MSDTPPWLTIIGLGEDGPDGLSCASRAAIDAAEVVMGAVRHLALLPQLTAQTIVWPVPFADGVQVLLGLRGRRVAMLASGDPFWFGAGTSVTRHLAASEWRALPAPSTFALAASRLGWPLEEVTCLGLHAAPLSRLRPYLCGDARLMVLLRDDTAVGDLAGYLVESGFGATEITVLESLGGPRERVRQTRAADFALYDIAHPVAAALCIKGPGRAIPVASGLDDDWFAHDGQITKRPVRALTLSALAPQRGEMLWDIGAGSGSISVEWLLTHSACQAIAIEADTDRATRLRGNADRLGMDRLRVVVGAAPAALTGLPTPDAVFIGGGISESLLNDLWGILPVGCRVVANAVTLESEALLAKWHARCSGSLLRIELAEAVPLGRKRGWKSSYPVVQWSVAR